MKLFLIVTALISVSAIADSIFIYKKENVEALFSPQIDGVNISGSTSDLQTFGLCVDFEKECEKSFEFKGAFVKNYARMNGYLNLPLSYFDQMTLPEFNLKMTSRIIAENETSLEIETNMDMAGLGEASKSVITIEKTPLKIDFKKDGEILPNRADYSDVTGEYKKLSSKVFQIMAEAENDGLAVSGGHGTGYLISEDGYGLTNRHVMESLPSCMSSKSCKMNVYLKGENVKSVSLNARLITCSKINDFCLFKIKPTLEMSHFELDMNNIENSLLTLGFPHDKTSSFSNGENVEDDTALTYSFGNPVGLMGVGVSSSLFIAGGASGSPVINASNLRVVGIISNGSNVLDSNDGMPGLFRSMFFINKEFNITSYLNGKNQVEIESYIKEIRDSSDTEKVDLVLEKYSRMKTYYGESKLKVLSYTHPHVQIRKKLVKFLDKTRDLLW